MQLRFHSFCHCAQIHSNFFSFSIPLFIDFVTKFVIMKMYPFFYLSDCIYDLSFFEKHFNVIVVHFDLVIRCFMSLFHIHRNLLFFYLCPDHSLQNLYIYHTSQKINLRLKNLILCRRMSIR